MKIQQTAFMLIGITLLFILVGLFALNFFLSDLKEQKQKLDEENAFLLVQRLADSPEFSCLSAFGTKKSACIDMDKAMVLKDYWKDFKKYWQVDGIEIVKVFPKSREECTWENYPNCGILTIFSKTKDNLPIGKEKYSFVSLCRKEKFNTKNYNKCEIGKLIIRVSDEK